MKTCPKCQNKYTDDSLQFCLQDGTLLSGEGTKMSNLETVAFEEPETVVRKATPQKVVKIESPPVEEAARITNPSYETQPEIQNSNTLRTIVLSVFGTVILFSLAAAGIWAYLNWNKNTVSRNGGLTNENKNSTAQITPTPTASKTPTPEKTKTPTPKPTPLPKDVKEKIEKEALATIFGWKTAAESKNLGLYMNNYSNNIAYYNKRGASRKFVENDKRKAFEKYDTIKSQFSNIVVTPSKNGEKATVVFDKEWNFAGEGELNTGKVRSHLVLKKPGVRSLFEADNDLKVYYVKK